MTIGIVTMDGENYGTVLQNYALQRVLREKGATVHTIRQSSRCAPVRFIRKYFIPTKTASVFQKLRLLNADFAYREKNARIRAFQDKYTTVICYKTSDELQNSEAKTDVLICGSDQIWNPQFVRYPMFTLDFAHEAAKCYSYAASIAVDYITETDKALYRNKLQKFKKVSVREKTGVKVLSEFVDKQRLRCDLDPVLLLEDKDWRKLASNRFENQKYLFVYMLRPMEELLYQAVELGTLFGLKVIYIGNYCYDIKGISTIYDAGVEDFLSAISNATLVLTNSFHATVFSVIFETQFLSVAISKTGSRVSDILQEIGLLDRIVDGEINADKVMQTIKFADAKKVLAQKRIDSLLYLDEIVMDGGQ